jgi:hypothetical protein
VPTNPGERKPIASRSSRVRGAVSKEAKAVREAWWQHRVLNGLLITLVFLTFGDPYLACVGGALGTYIATGRAE